MSLSFISSIFTIKPIVDMLHEDVLQYCEHIKKLKERVAELEKENALLRNVNSTKIKVETNHTPANVEPVIPKRTKPRVAKPKEVITIDDNHYATEAEAFEEKPVNVVVQPTTEKVVVVQDEKTRKDYQKEYQRNYRKLKKEKSACVNS